MLERAPYQVPSGEDEGRHREAESRLHVLYIQTGGIGTPAKEGDWRGESKIVSPHGKKRSAPEDLETEASKRGKKTSPGGPGPEGILAAQRPQRGQPSTEP